MNNSDIKLEDLCFFVGTPEEMEELKELQEVINSESGD